MRGYVGDRPVGLTDMNAQAADLYMYSFLPESDGTLAGIYIDIEGKQIGNSFSAALTATTAFTFASLGAIPAAAVGFLGRCTANLRVGRGGQLDGTRTQDPSIANYYQIPASESLVFGRVNG